MHPDIRTTPIELTLHGHGLRHDAAKGFGDEIMALLGRVWPALKGHAIPNDGINRVVYDSEAGQCTVFAGVVLQYARVIEQAGKVVGITRIG